MRLCYKAWDPLAIIGSKVLLTSRINGKNRGLSLSENLKLWSHGPFCIIFREDLEWYSLFTKCRYVPQKDLLDQDLRLYKPEFFADEMEWWTDRDVAFEHEDVERVVFMANSPATRIHPIKTKRIWNDLRLKYDDTLMLERDDTHYPPREAA